MTSIELIESMEHNIMNEELFQESFAALNMIKSTSFVEEDDSGRSTEVLKIDFKESNDDSSKTILLNLFSNQYKQVIITNFELPSSMIGKGFGMRILEIILDTMKDTKHELFIDNMTTAFYEKMLTRGAREAGNDENAVKVMNTTKLYSSD